MTRLSEPSSSSSNSQSTSKPSSSGSGKDPPPLDEHRKQILKTVQDDFIRMLAEKKIDTSVYGHGPDGKAGDERPLKPNEQNVKNKEREIKFREHIERFVVSLNSWRGASDDLFMIQCTGRVRCVGPSRQFLQFLHHQLQGGSGETTSSSAAPFVC